MLKLMLLRHAKSSWDDPHISDFDRPLSKRGRAAAPAIGAYMQAHGLEPAAVLCSPAKRAATTWKLAAGELAGDAAVEHIAPLYAFGGAGIIIEAIKKFATAQTPLLIVGHNPAIHDAAVNLITAGNTDARARLNEKYPTAALAVIEFPINDWQNLRCGSGLLDRFVRPRDLGT